MNQNLGARHRRVVGLLWGALLGGLMLVLGRVAMPTGGHNYLLGMACLLGVILGTILGAGCLVLLMLELLLSRKRKG